MVTDYIAHEGVAHDENPPGRGSGRYAWGSGENPHQHQFTFLLEYEKMRKAGAKSGEIATALLGEGASINQLKARIAIEREKEREFNHQTALKLLEKTIDKNHPNGNASEVARQMGRNESTIRKFLKDVQEERDGKYRNTAEMIRKAVDQKKYVDVGTDVELELGVTKNTKNVAIQMLLDEGYRIAYVEVPRIGAPDKFTNRMVLVAPDAEYKKVFSKDEIAIATLQDYSPDTGKQWWTAEYPSSIDLDRVYVRYAENGGSVKDGVIELRKGVPDLSLGDSLYSQVRIAVDDKVFMKGMAMYSDNIPEGYDVVYNTGKHEGTRVMPLDSKDKGGIMKPFVTNDVGEVDRDNPFGALIMAGGQSHYIDKDGKSQLSAINKVRDEGNWEDWSKTLSSQFLSKEPIKLIKQQIDLTLMSKQRELDEINQITNSIVKQQMLDNFAGACDRNSSDLKTVGFQDQSYKVFLPVESLKDNEVYCPSLKDGEEVAIIRYPHAGTFETVIATVNNKNKEGISNLGNVKDAIGINPTQATKLSGADYDGDAGTVIPLTTNMVDVTRSKAIEALQNFDTKEAYSQDPNTPKFKHKYYQTEMGKVTNLITDMTSQGAPEKDIIPAVQYSMVAIDAEKHNLDIKQAYKDFDIEKLKKEYQGVAANGQPKGGATIFSQSDSATHINKRKEITNTSIMTEAELKDWYDGKKVYRETGETYIEKKKITDPSKMTEAELARYNEGKTVYRETGKVKLSQETTTKRAAVDSAFELVKNPDNQKEVAYAQFSDDLASLANQARAISRSITHDKVNKVARETYKDEVASLNKKIEEAKLNSPRERQAQYLANQMASIKLKSNPDMDNEHKSRMQAQCLNEARSIVGSGKKKIHVTENEWNAIQSHAISATKVKEIVKNMDQTELTKLAMPKETAKLSSSQIAKAKTMIKNGATYALVAEALGVSTGYISEVVSK